MEKLRATLDKTIEIFSMIIMILMIILVTWQVITRYFLNKPSIVSVVNYVCISLRFWKKRAYANYIYKRFSFSKN